MVSSATDESGKPNQAQVQSYLDFATLKAGFSKQLEDAMRSLSAEMLEEISLLKARLARCERANRDLVARFDSAPWLVSEQMKKQQ